MSDDYGRLRHQWDAMEGRAEQDKWIAVAPETMPKPNVAVLAVYTAADGPRCVVRALWLTGEMLDQWDEDWDGEETKNRSGRYEATCGAFEANDFWRITEAVTHWQPLPAPPA